MGSKNSKGILRGDTLEILPRSWQELEQFYARYQQEVYRRRSTGHDAFFLSFEVFCAIVSSRWLDTAEMTHGKLLSDDEYKKMRLLNIFDVLDRGRRRRIAVMDFFAGLAMVTDAKKSTKFEFLISLLDNGGETTVNACELMMILAAAGRGLVLFKAVPPVDEDQLRPLARRLLGDSSEMLKGALVDRATTDPEVVFFMNDLENEAATTADSLLAQQGRILQELARLDWMQGRHLTHASSKMSRSAESAADCQPFRLSLDAMIRRLIATMGTNQLQQPNGTSALTTSAVGVKRYADARTLIRLVDSISDRSVMLTWTQAEHLLKEMNPDTSGFVLIGDVLRVMKAWILSLPTEKPKRWQQVGQYAGRICQLAREKWMAMIANLTTTTKRDGTNNPDLNRDEDGDGEINLAVNLHIKESDLKQSADASTRIRLSMGSASAIEDNRPQSSTRAFEHRYDESMKFKVEFRLKNGITEEQAIDVASAFEQFFSDEAIQSHINFLVESCTATIIGPSSHHDLRSAKTSVLHVVFFLQVDVFDMIQDHFGCNLLSLMQSFFVDIEFRPTFTEYVELCSQVHRQLQTLARRSDRESVFDTIFRDFDADGDGKWTLQEFNAFQQALGESALDDIEVSRLFGSKKEIAAGDLKASLEHLASDELGQMIRRLGKGSFMEAFQGSVTCRATLDLNQLQLVESCLSGLHWGDRLAKRMLWYLGSMKDWSSDFHFLSLQDAFEFFIGKNKICSLLLDVVTTSSWIHLVQDVTAAKHNEHDNGDCRSLLCSIYEELCKTPQQLELEDQQRNLAPGTTARLAKTLEKAYNITNCLVDQVNALEAVEMSNNRVRFRCELENADFAAFLAPRD
ncbi:hypothetical protein PINS_up015187 [Pythium insidiosum]|nr:hypothetical protein PINS_up015187 [Pythium insidiosum]